MENPSATSHSPCSNLQQFGVSRRRRVELLQLFGQVGFATFLLEPQAFISLLLRLLGRDR